MKKDAFIVLILTGLAFSTLIILNKLVPGVINLKSERIDLQNLKSPCRIERICGNLVGVDCASAVDGPYYYVDKTSEKIVEYCGGFCMSSQGRPRGKYCKNCPPKEWTCETY